MINEIKTIIQNYLNNADLCSLMIGTVVNGGIQISDKLTIPDELVKGDLKAHTHIGNKVRLIRNHGGQEFYIVEIFGRKYAVKGSTITLSSGGNTYQYVVEDVSE